MTNTPMLQDLPAQDSGHNASPDSPSASPALHTRFTDASPAEVLACLPAIGRLMVIVRANGVTHERIGVVESIAQDGGDLVLSGDCHDARIDLSAIAKITVDRSSVMKDKVYPRLECLDIAGEPVVAIVGMEGLAAFDHAISNLSQTPIDPPAKAPRDDKAADLDAADPAITPFETLRDCGAEVSIAMGRPGVDQLWRGKIESIKPAMGFLNVMTPDFHLHLKAGIVGAWQVAPGARIALDAAGQPTGLMLISEAFA